YSNLAGPLFDGVSDSAIDSNHSKKQGDTRENPEQSHRQTSVTQRVAHNGFECVRLDDWQAIVDFLQGKSHNSGGCFGLGRAAHEQIQKWTIALRPRPIKFDVVR